VNAIVVSEVILPLLINKSPVQLRLDRSAVEGVAIPLQRILSIVKTGAAVAKGPIKIVASTAVLNKRLIRTEISLVERR
jgi:hypothetical protein